MKLYFFAALLLITVLGNAQQLAPPTFSQTSGYYTSDITLNLSHGVPGVQIYYTLNGDEPTTSDILFTGGILLQSRVGEANNVSEIPTNPSFTYPLADYTQSRADNRGWLSPDGEVFKINIIRAKAFLTGYTPSETYTQSYFIDPSAAGLYDFPIVSLAMDSMDLFSGDSGIYVFGNEPDGNYTQKGEDWEKIGNFEMFELDGSPGYEQQIRVRMHGGGSRHSARKNLRLYGEYANNSNFNHAIFETTEQTKFKRIFIRAGGHRPDCFPRDDMANYFTEGLNADQQHYRYIILFVNGEYWGIHSLKERPDNYFFQNQYGIDDDFITVLDQEFDPQGGGHASDSLEMDNLETFISNSDMTITANYDYVEARIDVENYIDYMASEIFLSNEDWVYSNVVLWRKTGAYVPDAGPGHDGRFRWMLYDLDGGFGGSCSNAYYTVNTIDNATVETGVFSSYSRFFRGLLTSPIFFNKFVNRMCDLMNSNFKEAVLKEKLTNTYNTLTPEMMENVKRWRYPSLADNLVDRSIEIPSLTQWDTLFYHFDRFVDRRQRKIREHMIEKWPTPDSSLVTVDVNDQTMGHVKMNSILINNALLGVHAQVYPWKGLYMDSITVPLIAVPLPGYMFVEWQGTGVTDDTIYWMPLADSTFTAVFAIDNSYLPVVINEVMTSNSSFYSDKFQEFDDWLEVFNPNPYAVNLSNCTISKTGELWVIPEGTIVPPNGYKIIWHDKQTYQGKDHANFKLTNIIETVYLKRPDGTDIDFVTYPGTNTDESYGRFPNGSSTFTTFAGPTPNENNDFTGIDEQTITTPLEAYPNPTTDIVNLNKTVDCWLHDMYGRLIGQEYGIRTIDVSTLSPGVYILSTTDKESLKIIVQ